MAENDDVSGSPDRDAAPAESTAASAPEDSAPTAPQPAVPAEPAAAPILKTRWRDRAWSFRAMLAVALATLVIGGVAGGSIVALADDDGGDGHYRMGPWGPGGPMMGPGWRGNGPWGHHDGGPNWRWNDGPQQGPDLQAPTPTPSPGSTG